MNCEVKELEKPIKLDDGSMLEFEMRFHDSKDIPIIYVVTDYENAWFGFAYYVAHGVLSSVPAEFFDRCVDEFLEWSKANGYEVGEDEVDEHE